MNKDDHGTVSVEVLPTISHARFFEATGRLPENDDLTRVNCSIRGFGHSMCGWCQTCQKPFYECGGIHK